jgi:farnesyl diphosphate synthase
MGLAVQIVSDLVAAEAGGVQLRHPTVVSALGAERARAQAVALTAQAVRHLDLFDEKADLLRTAADYIGTRRAQRLP